MGKVHKLDVEYWDSWPELIAVSVCGRESVGRENVQIEEKWSKVTCLKCLRLKPKRGGEG